MKALKTTFLFALAWTYAFVVSAQVSVPSSFKHITIDGSFSDWTGVPLAYTAPEGPTNAIQYENIYIANDQTNLYIEFTLYSPRPTAFANSFDNIFLDTDDNSGTGDVVAGIGSEMLIQGGAGYQEKNGGFNEGDVNNLGWQIAGSADSTQFEIAISLGATFVTDNSAVFPGGIGSTIAILLEGDNTGYANTIFAPPSGGFVYSLAPQPATPTNTLALITLTNSSWEVNATSTDLGTNWLGQSYDDTVAGWTTGNGLFGYTTSAGSYPTIHKPLSAGPNTYYFRTHFPWTNDTGNVAFVVTNYMSDGAIYYINGAQVRSVRMPSGTVTYATAASATNSPVGHTDIFDVDGGVLQYGDNIMEVEAHQAPSSSLDMVFGMSLTASIHYPVTVFSTNLPVSQTILSGTPVTFTSDVIGSGPLFYQWYYNGTTPIPGANAAFYTIPVVTPTNAGSYSLQVSNSFSSATTPAAVLTVSNTPVIITGEPTNMIVVEGTPVTFVVAVSGTPPVSYQWAVGGVPILGATNITFSIAACALTNAGNYTITVTNQITVTNSTVASLTVLTDTVPAVVTSIGAGAGQIVVTFSKPVDLTTSQNAAFYAVNHGVTITSAVQNPANPAQVTLTTGVALTFGTVYTLTVNGVLDLFGNVAHGSGQFVRDITIDGSFNDWVGIAPIYTSSAPSGNVGAADFQAIYIYDDANFYYFHVTLWSDIDSSYGQFPAYVNMFFNTDNNPSTGYSAIGSDLLIQSGFGYSQKDGTFNDAGNVDPSYYINGLGFLSLPASPGTNFEFEISKAATYNQDGTLVFPTNVINILFQGMTPSFVVENTVPPDGGVITYNNGVPATAAELPLGKLAITKIAGGQGAIIWNSPGTLQVASVLAPNSWANLPGATSPYVIPLTGPKLFYRLIH